MYPDMETALIGQFENGTMVAAKPSKVIAERCHRGIKEIRVAKPKAVAPEFAHSRPSKIRMCPQPTVMDPLERKNIFISDGKKEDGVFARRHITAGDLIAYYSGSTLSDRAAALMKSNTTFAEM